MKLQPQQEIIDIYDTYDNFMKAEKRAKNPFIIEKRKKNHEDSLYSCENLTLNGEIRNSDRQDYSFQIQSDIIKSRVIFRYDTGGGVHKNNVPYIPLSQQSIDTPHFHRFDRNGYFLAYKTDKLNIPGQAKALFDIEFGFPYFCQESNIKGDNVEDSPQLIVRKDGEIGFFFDNSDPNEGVNF